MCSLDTYRSMVCEGMTRELLTEDFLVGVILTWARLIMLVGIDELD